jgi:hypothetical protein
MNAEQYETGMNRKRRREKERERERERKMVVPDL